jgi:integrase
VILDGYLADRAPHTHSPTITYCCVALKAHLNDLPVDLLTKEIVRRYTEDRRGAGAQGASARHRKKLRPLSDGTLIRELGTLRAALAWAVRERWIAHAPHVERPSAPQPRERWLTHDEAERMILAATTPHIRLFIALALYTAGRAGALLQLTWDRVDLRSGTVDLGESRGKKRRPKLPIIDELRGHLESAAATATSPFVIEYGGAPVASIKTGFRSTVRRAGLSGVTPHVLRHTAATWMVQRNVPVGMIAAWLGNTEQMIQSVYGHHSPEWLRQAAEAFSMPAGRGNILNRK